MLLFIIRGIHDLLFTLFIYFYYFIKKLYFILHQMNNKISFYFLSNHYFFITIFLYLFNYETSLFSKILFTKKMKCYNDVHGDGGFHAVWWLRWWFWVVMGCSGHGCLEERQAWRFIWEKKGKKGILRILGVHQVKNKIC